MEARKASNEFPEMEESSKSLHDDREVADGQCDRRSEQQQNEHRKHQHERQRKPIAQDLDQFFAGGFGARIRRIEIPSIFRGDFACCRAFSTSQ